MDERRCPIADHARLDPHQLALITDDETWTYAACDTVVQALCVHLISLNVQAGNRVAFIARNTAHSIFLLFALFRLQAIACPLSFREPEAILYQRVKDLQASHYLNPCDLPLHGAPSYGCSTVKKDALATFLFTSGSSAHPKIACHTLDNHLYNALGAIAFFSLNPTSRWLLSLSLFHVGGLAILFRMFCSGGSIVLSHLPLLQALQAHSITHLSCVPTQLYRLLREDNLQAAEKLVCLLLGGAPLPPTLIAEAIHRGLPLFTTYGMTEMSSIITAAQTPTYSHMGKPLAFRELSLSTEGEILVRGQTLFSGYWDKERILSTGVNDWFCTRDIGAFTTDGICLLGRKDRLFISGGENMHPEEIERALCSIPGIVSATVFPIPDREFGHRPGAFIQDDTGAHSLETIRQALASLLPAFKHPVRISPYPLQHSFKLQGSQ